MRTRMLCLAAGLLCVTGIVSGAVLRANEAAHHHAPVAAAVVTTVADGHGANARADQHALATVAPVPFATNGYRSADAAAVTAPDVASIDSIRTRGPPQWA